MPTHCGTQSIILWFTCIQLRDCGVIFATRLDISHGDRNSDFNYAGNLDMIHLKTQVWNQVSASEVSVESCGFNAFSIAALCKVQCPPIFSL